MDTASIWLLRMFLKLLNLLDLNSLASLLGDNYWLCRDAKTRLTITIIDNLTFECNEHIWLGYVLWLIVIASGYFIYLRYKKVRHSKLTS